MITAPSPGSIFRRHAAHTAGIYSNSLKSKRMSAMRLPEKGR